MRKPTKYNEQLDRVKRWFERFKEIEEGRSHDRQSDNYQDDVYAFFMNCYHLKDWIKNDTAASSVAGKVEDYVSNSRDLSLCADICNGLKHLVLNSERSGEDPEFDSRKFEVGVGTHPPTIAVHYTINTKSGPIDAFSLATKCLDDWENFISFMP